MDAVARARGFTLLEVLVVVAIAAVLSVTFATLASPSDAATAEKEARRLALLLELAFAESRASGRALAWRPEPGGYSFWRRDDDGDWVALPADGPYRRRTFPSGIALRSGEAVVLHPYGFAAPMEVTIAAGSRRLVVQGGVLGRFTVARLYAD